MARLPRLVVPGLAHHITQRGNRRQTVFFSVGDSRYYIGLLREHSRKAGLDIRAWCLMPNHVHIIAIPECEDSIRAAIAETHRRYTRHINVREGWRGHLWQERFHSFPMDEPYLYEAVRYVELNPVRAGLARRPQDWRWCSAWARLRKAGDPLITDDDLPDQFGNWRAYLEEGLARDGVKDDHGENPWGALRMHGRTGRPLGDEAFLDRLEQRTGRTLKPGKPGPKPKQRDGRGQLVG